jgi:hypothetical protein
MLIFLRQHFNLINFSCALDNVWMLLDSLGILSSLKNGALSNALTEYMLNGDSVLGFTRTIKIN